MPVLITEDVFPFLIPHSTCNKEFRQQCAKNNEVKMEIYLMC